MIEDKLVNLPTEPGCYLMKNRDGDVIYVGKAKNLKNRVKSYFIGAHNAKTTLLVSEIVDFSYIQTNSEQESLILELNLIKKYNPKYNIKLTDDKTYLYLKIEEKPYPKVVTVREKNATGELFGPYPNQYSAKETARLLNRVYPLRPCEEIIPHEDLFFYLDKHLEPCYNDKLVDYDKQIEKIKRFLKGDNKEVIEILNKAMKKASDNFLYEEAMTYRDLLEHINKTTEKQIVSLNDYKDRDAISYAFNDDDVAIHILIMRRGQIVDYVKTVLSYVGDCNSFVLGYLNQYYETIKPDEILFSNQFSIDELNLLFGKRAVIPKKGDKKRLVDLAKKNAIYDLDHYSEIYRNKKDKENKINDSLLEIFKRKINYIEVFDNAQLFGTAPISALIVFENHQFNKSKYRRFHLKTTKNDDYQAMKEVVYRRYYRLLIENKKIPDLVLVDGGIGQVNSAKEVIDSINLNCLVAGLKKNSKHEFESLVFDNQEIVLNKNNDIYKFFAKISEEVHRYAISFHRQTRNKKGLESILDNVNGLGEKRKKLLLSHFKSIEDIKKASFDELKSIGLGEKVINNLKEVLK